VRHFAELADGPPVIAQSDGPARTENSDELATCSAAWFEIPRPTRVAKRALDLTLSLPLAVLSLPVLGALAVAVRVSSRGPAFFRQTRIGRHGETFAMWKIRSMHLDAEQQLHANAGLRDLHQESGFKLPPGRDPRVTRLGRVLRRSSLDELPQLWHVVSGRMSLVGPRPVVEAELRTLYGSEAAYYLSLRPGLTGLWQVKGRSKVTHKDRCALDVEYATSVSLGRDLSILLRTVPAVARAHGAH
jgi:lipopolysaccharide/colanic/teichoic acid biosynthesis glycosyltransferase